MFKYLQVFFTHSIIFILIISISITIVTAGDHVAHNKLDINTIEKALVMIQAQVHTAAYQRTGIWYGTGFIVDKARGLIVTNSHVVGGPMIGLYRLTFYNGRQSEARVIYYDQYVDVALLQMDIKELPEQCESIEFTDDQPKLGSSVFVLSNAEGQGFSFHQGYLSDLYAIDGSMPQGSYVMNMNSAGGASGSPVLNEHHKAIGVLYGGGKTYALALKGGYVQHILKSIQNGVTPPRKQIGILTELYSLDAAVTHRHFPHDMMTQYIKEFPNSRNRVIVVKTVLPGTVAANTLKAGDIIWQVNDKKIGADLLTFDLLVSSAQSNTIKLTIIRDGKIITDEYPIYDLNKNKVNTIVDFGGGLFFSADDYIAAKYGIPIGSVTMITAQNGSAFSQMNPSATIDGISQYRIQIKSILQTNINSLDDLIRTINTQGSPKYIQVEYVNFLPYMPNFDGGSRYILAHERLIQDITFDNSGSYNIPRILRYDPQNFIWQSELLNKK